MTTHEAIPASNFTEDKTSPVLLDFDIDLDRETITLIFDETVRANTIVEEEIILLNAANLSEASSYHRLTSGSASQQDSTVITVYLTTEDLNVIKRLTDLATDPNNTFIAFNSSLIMDMNSNPIEPISVEEAKAVRNVLPDLTSPELVLFTIDLTFEQLVLTFSETVNASSLSISEFAIQGAQERGDFRQLADSNHSTLDSTVVTIFLGLDDLNEIKRLTSVATSVDNSYLTATQFAIRDMNGNLLVPIAPTAALNATDFTDDIIRPRIVSFNLNISSELLTISFSETVRASTHSANAYTILSAGSIVDSLQSYRLTGGISSSFDSHTLQIELNLPDLNELKRLTELATSENNTFLAVEAGAVFDMNNNLLLPISDTLALQVDQFTEDTVPPTLQSFNLDMNTGILTLMFSETINASSFEVTQITLQDAANIENVTDTHMISNYSINLSVYDSTVITVQIVPLDLNEIKRLYNLAIDSSSTYIAITSLLVRDMNNKYVVEIPSEEALRVSVYVSDRNPPQLEEFDLNLNSSELLLRFNETVNRESLNIESVTIQHAQSSSGPSFTLQLTQTSSSMSPNDTYIIVDIGTFDLNNLKRLTEVATSRNNTYLSLNSTAIEDMNENAIVQIPGTNGLQVTNFVQDQIRPVLTGFSLDINQGILVLTFSETVQAVTLNISTITLQSQSVVIPEESYTLNQGDLPEYSYSNSTDDPILTVYIGTSDLNAIKAIFELANTPNDTFLAITEDGVLDMVDLALEPIPSSFASAVDVYVADTTGPELLSFSFNLTSETLELTFDETINIESFNITQLILLSNPNISIGSYKMLRGYRALSMDNSTTVSVLLILDDLHDIKLDTNLATNTANTWLQILQPAIHDMAFIPNYVQSSIENVAVYEQDLTSPMLLSFYVDMNEGLLVLNFDEPVNASSIDYTAFTVYSGRVASDAEMTSGNGTINETIAVNATMVDTGSGQNILTQAPTSYTLTGGSTNSTNGLQITIILTVDDLNAIKQDEQLFTSTATSFISIEPSSIADMNANPVAEISSTEALQATAFINDTTPPVLLGFDLDMNMGILVLSFPETIDVSTTMFDGIILQRGPNVSLDANQYMLVGGRLTMLDDGLTASIEITLGDLNEIKRRRIALSPETAWLTIDESTILDMSDQGVVAVVNGVSARMVSMYMTDSTPPELQTFTLNLDREILTLYFSETVDVFLFNITALSFQDTRRGNNTFNHYTLTSSSYLNSTSSPVIEVVLGLEDLNNIKQLTELATEIENTYLSVTSDLVQDVFGNNLQEISTFDALLATEVVTDVTNPVLEAFDIDLDSRIITLYFSETVNATSLNVSGISLIGAQELTAEMFQLDTSYTNSTNNPTIEIMITRNDFNIIKMLTNLATSESDTYLIIDPEAISDMAGNPVVAISPQAALQVRNYTKDTTSPVLESFDLDMNGVTLILEFSETVNVSSIDFTSITLVDSTDPFPQTYTLLGGETALANGPTVVIQFIKEDEDNLKRIDGLATSANNTYLVIRSDTIVDMDGNPVENITFTDPLPVRNFTPDSTPPVLDYFNLDLTLDLLTLVFSETVNVSSLDISGVTLQSTDMLDNTTLYYTLSDSMFDPSFNDPIVEITLSRFDGNEIRRLFGLATSPNNTYLSLEGASVLDMVSLPVVAIQNFSGQAVLNFTADLVSPELEAFSLDLTEEVLSLNFSETVDISTFDATQLTLHGSQMLIPSYTLTGGIVTNNDNTPYVTFNLTTADLNIIKLDTSLASSFGTTFLSLTSATVEDMNSNPIVPIPIPVPPAEFIQDIVPPELVQFELDLNQGLVTLVFSETVNADSLDVTQITFQAESNTTQGLYSLTNGSFSESNNGTTLVVNISLSDLNRLKQLAYLAVDNDTSYISVSGSTVVDMNDIPVVEISFFSALQVSRFISDTTSPELLSFLVDLDMEILILSFSETVNVSSLDVTGIALQAAADSSAISVPLTMANVSLENDPMVILTFSQVDLNLIKSITELATSENNTFITVTSSVVADMFGNLLTPILPSFGLQADRVLLDKTSPELLGFELDMNSGLLTFYFSESVNATSLDPTQLTIQQFSSDEATASSYTLTELSEQPLMVLYSVTVVQFYISTYDLNSIKAIVTLATSERDTYLSITSSFIQDQFGNNITAINSSGALPVLNYTRDSGCPYLQSFDFDLDSGMLFLTFQEPVNTSTFEPAAITMLNEANIQAANQYSLTSGNFNHGEYTRFVTLTLSDYDLNQIKANIALGTADITTNLFLSELAVLDTSRNSYCNSTSPIVSTNFTQDTTSPVLLNFTLNMNTGILTLTFSEVVDIPLRAEEITLLAEPDLSQIASTMIGSGSGDTSSTFNMTGSGLAANGSGMMVSGMVGIDLPSVVAYTLTGGSSSINLTTAPHVVTFALTPDDLNEIKHLSELATSTTSTFISITTATVNDFSSNDNVEIPRYSPLQASEFLPDFTRPQLISFDLNMDSRVLTLSFTEVINISSFDVTAIMLQSQTYFIMGTFYSLQNSTTAFETLTRVSVFLSDEDANNIKRITSLATSINNTHLSIMNTLVRDTFNNPVKVIMNITGIRVTDYIGDGTPPVFTSFSFDLSSEVLSLTFDETVNATSVQPQLITFQSDSSGSDPVPLTGGIVSSEDSTIIYIQLVDIDLHNIKRSLNLATRLNNTCLTLAVMTLSDLSLPPNDIQLTTLCAESFTEDLVSPQLTTFGVNLNIGILTLNFDEPIDIASMNLTLLTLQAAQVMGPGVEEVTLSGGEATTVNGLQVLVNISIDDLNIIKQHLMLLRALESSFISIPPEFVSDLNGNPVVEIGRSNALQASFFVDDETRPLLLAFDLDMNTAYLSLYFSETVDVSSLDFTGITLQLESAVTQPEHSYTLTAGRILGDNSPTVIIEITNDDLNVLKTRQIGRTNITTWIVLRNSSVLDITAQPVLPNENGINALPVREYMPDITPPLLLSFSLDLTAETLSLSFNESVDAMTLDVTQITIAAGINVTSDDLSYTLTNLSTSMSGNLPEIVIDLNVVDLNEIKRKEGLATSENNTYIFFTSLTIADTFGNLIVEMAPLNAVKVTQYIADAINPELTGFDLDMNTGVLTLNFTETVNSSSLDTSGITFYSTMTAPLQTYTLSGFHNAVTASSDVIWITLTNDDLNELKVRQMLAVSNSSTFLSLTPDTIRDMNNNMVSSSPVFQVRNFVPDTTPPTLRSFSIDMDSGQLTLNFDETVQSMSLQSRYLALISNMTFVPTPADPDDQHQLTGGTVLTSNMPSVTFQFTEDDLNEIKRQDMCTRARGVNDCFLVYRSDAILDMNGNGIEGCRQVDA